MATTSGVSSAAIPIPGPDVAVDVGLLITSLAIYYKEFGLNNLSPDVIAKLPQDVQEIITTRYQFKNVNEFIRTTAAKTLVKSMAVEEGFKLIPMLGSVAAGGISFSFMLYYLWCCINDLEKAALAVWDSGVQCAQNEYDHPGQLNVNK